VLAWRPSGFFSLSLLANKAVISLLERKSDAHKKRKPGIKEYHGLDSFAGSWTKKEAAEFNKAPAA
jgi:hypothetical protein